MVQELTQVSAEATARAVRNGAPVVLAAPFRDAPAGTRGLVCESVVAGSVVLHVRIDWLGTYPIKRMRVAIDPTDRVGRACLAWALEEADPHLWWVAGIVARVHPDETLGAELELRSIMLMSESQRADVRRLFDLLAHLDPTDDTRLKDGSRWVDAEALVLVANRVLGGDDAE